MTEDQWLSATEPQAMLEFLRSTGRLTERKARLFAVACCRRIWPLLTETGSREAVGVTERYADGQATDEELTSATEIAHIATYVKFSFVDSVLQTPKMWTNYARWNAAAAAYLATRANPVSGARAAAATGYHAASHEPKSLAQKVHATRAAEEAAVQATLLRCLLPNQFRPSPRLGAAVLAWNDRTVVRIAEAIYQEQQWDNVGILADALDEAGCEDAGIIEHLRGPGPHCRGCHVIDGILGKA